MSETNKNVFALSVDFEGGDGADLFEIPEDGNEEAVGHIRANFPELLFASYPPPSVKIVEMTAEEWKEAERIGKELA